MLTKCYMSASLYDSLRSMLCQQMAMIFNILATLVFPTIMQTINTLQWGERQPYHTSILSGEAWVQELLHSHPRHIRTELGVEEPVFRELVIMLHNMGNNNSKNVTLEEQLVIFLYTCVTGLTSTHIGERFQRSGETITRYLELDTPASNIQ